MMFIGHIWYSFRFLADKTSVSYVSFGILFALLIALPNFRIHEIKKWIVIYELLCYNDYSLLLDGL